MYNLLNSVEIQHLNKDDGEMRLNNTALGLYRAKIRNWIRKVVKPLVITAHHLNKEEKVRLCDYFLIIV